MLVTLDISWFRDLVRQKLMDHLPRELQLRLMICHVDAVRKTLRVL